MALSGIAVSGMLLPAFPGGVTGGVPAFEKKRSSMGYTFDLKPTRVQYVVVAAALGS